MTAVAREIGPLPDGLPPIPAPARSRRLARWGAPANVAFAALPVTLMLASILIGGGPRTEGADDALLTLAMRDAARRGVLIGPYSRFGWHHPGPTYLYLAGIPTWLWGGSPTGSWVGACLLGIGCAVALVLIVRRAAGARAGWWAACGLVLVVTGLGATLFRDPWNPYVVVLPVLLTAVTCALAMAGARGALVWSAVVGTVAVQTHLSCAPLVVGLVALAVAVSIRRWSRRPHRRLADIPSALPSLIVRERGWWRRHPEESVAVALLVLEWLPPLWDQLFGTHNLSAIWRFFTTAHGTVGVADAWREVTAILGVTMFQHHAALRDGVRDTHPWLTTLVFAGLVAAAVALGVRRHRPAACWLGVCGAVGGVLAVYSVTRVVGEPFRYLVVWMAVLPVLPALGVVIGLQDLARPWAARLRPTLGVVVVVVAALGVSAVVKIPPAVAATNKDTARAWALLAPVVAGNHDPVRLVLNDGNRWPLASGLALQLERYGHPARVDAEWELLFGSGRVATGREPIVVYLASTDKHTWPPATQATSLGPTGVGWVFIGRQGPPCWDGWIPFGGPACPV